MYLILSQQIVLLMSQPQEVCEIISQLVIYWISYPQAGKGSIQTETHKLP
jgi:hypothetical protein